MFESILEFEPVIRLSFFLGVFALVALWETAAPRRQRQLDRLRRWPSNLGIVVLNTAVLRVLFPVAAVAMAVNASASGWGLFNLIDLPTWVEAILAVIILDAAVYMQHVMFHAVPLLWRLHRMHHTDLDYDVTTGARFHPIEIVVSMLIKLAAVAAIGASPVAVIIFEILLNATAMFNHGNIRLALPVDRVLRLFVVTPDMHRVHHSVIPYEANSNFGFNLPWWDRLFGTYRDQPEAGHDGMTIGINSFRNPEQQRLDKMLLQPFKNGGQGYVINAKRGGSGRAPENADT